MSDRLFPRDNGNNETMVLGVFAEIRIEWFTDRLTRQIMGYQLTDVSTGKLLSACTVDPWPEDCPQSTSQSNALRDLNQFSDVLTLLSNGESDFDDAAINSAVIIVRGVTFTFDRTTSWEFGGGAAAPTSKDVIERLFIETVPEVKL